MNYARRNPLTFGYVLVLIATCVLVNNLLSAAAADRLLQDVSTTPYNLAHDPVGSMLGSALVADTRGALIDTILTNAFGIALCMAVLERRTSAKRAAGVFLGGHIIGTLVASVVTVTAVHTGRYPAAVAHDLDFGVSYGAIAVSASLTPLFLRWAQIPWAAFLVLYPFANADWYGDLPDFTTIGHFTAALTGLVLGFAVFRRSRALGPKPSEPDQSPMDDLDDLIRA